MRLSSFMRKVALTDHETEKVAWNVKSDRANIRMGSDGYVHGGPSSNKPAVTFVRVRAFQAFALSRLLTLIQDTSTVYCICLHAPL